MKNTLFRKMSIHTENLFHPKSRNPLGSIYFLIKNLNFISISIEDCKTSSRRLCSIDTIHFDENLQKKLIIVLSSSSQVFWAITQITLKVIFKCWIVIPFQTIWWYPRKSVIHKGIWEIVPLTNQALRTKISSSATIIQHIFLNKKDGESPI